MSIIFLNTTLLSHVYDNLQNESYCVWTDIFASKAVLCDLRRFIIKDDKVIISNKTID